MTPDPAGTWPYWRTVQAWPPPRAQQAQISRLPYTPGLDGLRALAVIAVMVYHANHTWLPGGFLGVEVFFVISGYLITLLLIGEHERKGRIGLKRFWLRRARRLLPALVVLLAGTAIYLAFFNRAPQGQARGDFVGAATYGSNWYQIVVGQGYTAAQAFAPLRHLWSLAVEEQFYLVWPLVMVLVLRTKAATRLPKLGLWLFGAERRVGRRSSACSTSRATSPPRAGPPRCTATGPSPVGASTSTRRSTWARSPGPAGCCSARRWPCGGARWRSCAARCATSHGGSTCWPCSASSACGCSCSRLYLSENGVEPRAALRPVAVPRRPVPHRPGHAGDHRRRHPSAQLDRQGARQPAAALDRPAQLRAVPVPLADLPDHPQGGRDRPRRSSSSPWRWSSPSSSPSSATGWSRCRCAPGGSASGCAASAWPARAGCTTAGAGWSPWPRWRPAFVGFAGVSIATADDVCVGALQCSLQYAGGTAPPPASIPPAPTTTTIAASTTTTTPTSTTAVPSCRWPKRWPGPCRRPGQDPLATAPSTTTAGAADQRTGIGHVDRRARADRHLVPRPPWHPPSSRRPPGRRSPRPSP